MIAACLADRQAIQYELAYRGDLALYDRGVFAGGSGAAKYGATFQLARAFVELYTDIRGNHWPEISNVLRRVHTKEDEDQRVRFIASAKDATEQEGESADHNSSHGQSLNTGMNEDG